MNETGPKAYDVPWGTGVCDVKGMLTEVHRQGVKAALLVEYEHNWENSLPEIAQCVKYFDQMAAELARPGMSRPALRRSEVLREATPVADPEAVRRRFPNAADRFALLRVLPKLPFIGICGADTLGNVNSATPNSWASTAAQRFAHCCPVRGHSASNDVTACIAVTSAALLTRCDDFRKPGRGDGRDRLNHWHIWKETTMLATEQEAEVKQAAEQLLAQEPDWVTFYREILGPHGVVRHTFPTRETLAAFERSEAYQEILQMLNQAPRAWPRGAGGGGADAGNHGPAAQKPSRSAAGRGPRAPHQHEQALHLEAAAIHRGRRTCRASAMANKRGSERTCKPGSVPPRD